MEYRHGIYTYRQSVIASVCDEHFTVEMELATGSTDDLIGVRRLDQEDDRYSCHAAHAPATWVIYKLSKELT